jgi:hypothetical protein
LQLQLLSPHLKKGVANVKKSIFAILALAALALIAAGCLKTENKKGLSLGGKITIETGSVDAGAALFVAVARGDNYDALRTDPGSLVAAIITVDPQNPTFNINLAKSGLKPGDKVAVIAFINRNYKGTIPVPGPGDFAGIYIDQENFAASYTLKEGHNSNLNIIINREHFDYEKEINGKITGSYRGDLIALAYAGEVSTLSFKNLDFGQVIAFKKMRKDSQSLDYKMKIIPYGHNLPIKNVFLFVLFDQNGNGRPDPGEKVSYYSTGLKGLPSLVTINDNIQLNLNIDTAITIPEPSAGSMTLSGKVVLNHPKTENSKPLFVILTSGDSDEAALNPKKAVRHFQKLQPDENDFNLDLSQTSLVPGERVMILILKDNDFAGGFPDATPGDVVGFYYDNVAMSQHYKLQGGANANISIKVDREVFGFDKKISGVIKGEFVGSVTVIAYAGELTSLDAGKLDLQRIVGIKTFEKTATNQSYTLPILPYGFNLPLQNCHILAIFDNNGNDRPDPGEQIGYYADAQRKTPLGLTLDDSQQTDIDIDPVITLAAAAGSDITLSGELIIDNDAIARRLPIFVVVAQTDDPEELLSDPVRTIKAFARLVPGQSKYEIDLRSTALRVNDEVMIFAIIDRDATTTLPSATAGDILGFYANYTNMSLKYRLQEGKNANIDFKVSRELGSFEKYISGTIAGDYTGDVVVFAYNRPIESMDFTQLDFDQVIAFKKIRKLQPQAIYKMQILPLGITLPVHNVQVFAMYDANGNGKPDSGELLGCYSTRSDRLPSLITVGEAPLTDINIDVMSRIAVPSGAKMSLEGALSLPPEAQASSEPVYIVVASAENPADIASSPLNSIKYFQRVNPASARFSIDLSATGLKPGDEVMVLAIWDRDFAGGFPSLSAGDKIGYYKNYAQLSETLTLTDGLMRGIDLAVERDVYDYDKEIKGAIGGNYSGNLLVFAYTGEIDSSDLTKLDFDKIVAFQKFYKGAAPLRYSLKILPYGNTLPLAQVYVFVLYDSNGNGKPDADEMFGGYSVRSDKLPTPLTVGSDPVTDINLNPFTVVPYAAASGISLTGRIFVPTPIAGTGKPFYIIVTKAENPSGIMANPAAHIKYFSKVDPRGGTYTINLDATDLTPDEEVMIMGLWDLDYSGGFPGLSAGDLTGFYKKTADLAITHRLTAGLNSNLDLQVDRTVTPLQKSIEVSVGGAYQGNMLLVAYGGDIESMDFTAIDFNKVIAYRNVAKTAPAQNFTLELMPLDLALPVSNVYLLAVYDANGNKRPDPGEQIGYFSEGGTALPKTVTIDQQTTTVWPLTPYLTVPYASGQNITLEGTVDMPSDYALTAGRGFVMVAKTSSMQALFDEPLSVIKTIQKLPPGGSSFSINLAATDLAVGDEVMIVALWDKDSTRGLPNPTEGDWVGIYENKATFKTTHTLTTGVNAIRTAANYQFAANRRMVNHSARVTYTLSNGSYTMKAGDRLIVLAVQSDGVSASYRISNMDSIIGMQTFDLTSATDFTHELSIMTALPGAPGIVATNPFGIEDVYMYAIVDTNKNGQPDSGEPVAYACVYVLIGFLPTTFDLVDGPQTLGNLFRFETTY